jgi:DNA-binding MarR family transcriptional regulator
VSEPSHAPSTPTRENLGFRLAKASQRWNELLHARLVVAGYPEVRPSYGSVLVPLYEEDGLRMGELANRARLSKQTMTTMVRLVERDGLVDRRPDPDDGRAARVYLTARGRRLEKVVGRAIAELDALVRDQLGSHAAEAVTEGLAQLGRLGEEKGRPGAGG